MSKLHNGLLKFSHALTFASCLSLNVLPHKAHAPKDSSQGSLSQERRERQGISGSPGQPEIAISVISSTSKMYVSGHFHDILFLSSSQLPQFQHLLSLFLQFSILTLLYCPLIWYSPTFIDKNIPSLLYQKLWLEGFLTISDHDVSNFSNAQKPLSPRPAVNIFICYNGFLGKPSPKLPTSPQPLLGTVSKPYSDIFKLS